MTIVGWLQIALVLALVVGRRLSARQLHRRPVRGKAHLPVARPGSGGARAVSGRRGGPGGRAGMDPLHAVHVGLRRRLLRLPLRPDAAPEPASTQPAGVRRRPARSRVQYRRQLHHQRQLAGLRRRDDDEPSDADARPHREQLPRFGGRDGDRDRGHQGHRARRDQDHRQLLGRSDARDALSLSAALHRRRRWSSSRSASRRRSRDRSKRRRSKAPSRSFRWVPSRARKRSS